jgi:hypothetical protein
MRPPYFGVFRTPILGVENDPILFNHRPQEQALVLPFLIRPQPPDTGD